MKKIINKKIYDTKKAQLIANYHNGYPCTDFNYMEEALYKTEKGAWFLAGEGGAFSKYAESCGNGAGYGTDLIVFTKDEAYKRLEKRSSTKEIKEHFKDEIEEA